MNQRPPQYSFQRYLASKRTIDDRALNHHVWESLHQAIAGKAHAQQPLTLLEIGGGIGTMVERLLEDGRLPRSSYHLLDAEAENIATADERLSGRFATFPLKQASEPTDTTPFLLSPTMTHRLHTLNGSPVDIYLYTKDLFDFLAIAGPLTSLDLIIAHAFMDLVDVPSTLPLLTATMRPGTLLYFTINFDGATVLEPAIDSAFDAHIEQIYHRTMDERITAGKPSGDSHTGRHLFHQMQTAGIHIIDTGSSDWVVIPHQGIYPHDESYFLHFIIHTMHGALRHHPEIDSARFEQWIQARHAQIEQGELIYIAHQLDYLGKYEGERNQQPDDV
jgi:hypothetical protein